LVGDQEAGEQPDAELAQVVATGLEELLPLAGRTDGREQFTGVGLGVLDQCKGRHPRATGTTGAATPDTLLISNYLTSRRPRCSTMSNSPARPGPRTPAAPSTSTCSGSSKCRS